MKKRRSIASISLACITLLLASCTVVLAEGKIHVSKVLFASSVETFGIYTEESSSRFQSGANTVIYMEIADFETLEQNGSYNLDVALDFSVIDSSGQEVIRKNDPLILNKSYKSKVHDLFFAVGIGFTDWPQGEYRIILTIRDNLAKSFSREELAVEIFE